jgi:hypothetical protein
LDGEADAGSQVGRDVTGEVIVFVIEAQEVRE